MRVLIAGCGYVGTAVGSTLLAQGHAVTGLRRSPSGVALLQTAGLNAFAVDLTNPAHLATLPSAWDWVVFCGAPPETTEAAYRAVYFEGARQLVRWLEPRPPRAFVFTGSTSVYGQNDGSIVTEDSPVAPATPTGQVLVETEALLLNAARSGFPARLLRIAGIYGPERNRIRAVLEGTPRGRAAGTHFLNVVHLDDVVRAIIAVLDRGRDGQIYNVCDGAPIQERELVLWLMAELHSGSPDDLLPAPNPSQRTRQTTHKRVNADKLRAETGWEPIHPDLRAGYRSLLASMSAGRAPQPGPASTAADQPGEPAAGAGAPGTA